MDIEAVDHIAGSRWLEFRFSGGPRVLVKFGEDDNGRAVMTRLIAVGALDSQIFRALPLGRIEAIAGVLFQTPDGVSIPAPLSGLTQRRALYPKKFQEVDKRLDDWLALSAEHTPAAIGDTIRETRTAAASAAQPREPLSRPDGTDPDAFAERVAQAYQEAVVTSSTPAKVLAAEAKVPVTTVHRWIREARRRGALRPARKGRAG